MRVNRARTLAALIVAGSLSLGAARESTDRPIPAPVGTQEAEVLGIVVDPQSRQPLVVLQGRRDQRNLAMAIGQFEANGIAIPLQGVRPPRPLTHDLMLTLLGDLKARLVSIVITDLRDDVYYARLHLEVEGTPLLVDSRPSDAIALALRAKVPILVEDRVFTKAERREPRTGPTRPF